MLKFSAEVFCTDVPQTLVHTTPAEGSSVAVVGPSFCYDPLDIIDISSSSSLELCVSVGLFVTLSKKFLGRPLRKNSNLYLS